MTYTAPLPQIVALIESSGNCSQSIKLECQSAPLQVSSTTNRIHTPGPLLMQTLQFQGNP